MWILCWGWRLERLTKIVLAIASDVSINASDAMKGTKMPEQKTRISLSILSPVYEALELEARDQTLDVVDLAERILEEHALAGSFMNADDKGDVRMYRSLIQRVINAASSLVEKDGFCDSITADTVAFCMTNAEWRADYSKYIGGDAYKNGNPKKQNINPSFGYWIKKTLGAKSKMKNGKPENRKVLGSIIQSYTPLER
jgi:hypothetical protein